MFHVGTFWIYLWFFGGVCNHPAYPEHALYCKLDQKNDE